MNATFLPYSGRVAAPMTMDSHASHVQLWLALPDAARDGTPGFVHHAPEAVERDGVTARVFLGSRATKLIRYSPVPVLVVPRSQELTVD